MTYMLNVIMLNVIMLNVIMLNVILLSVVAPSTLLPKYNHLPIISSPCTIQILDLFFKFNSILYKKAQLNKLLFAKPQIPIVNVVICG